MSKPSRTDRMLNQTGDGRGQGGFRTFRLLAGTPLYFATTLVPKKSGRPPDGPEILTPLWLRNTVRPFSLSQPAKPATSWNGKREGSSVAGQPHPGLACFASSLPEI